MLLLGRSLFICFVFSYALDSFAGRLVSFLDMLVDLDSRRPKSTVWTPSGFRKLGRKIRSKHEVDPGVVPLSMGTSNDPTSFSDGGESDSEDEEEVIVEEKDLTFARMSDHMGYALHLIPLSEKATLMPFRQGLRLAAPS